MSEPTPERAVVLPPRRTGAASALIRANRPPAADTPPSGTTGAGADPPQSPAPARRPAAAEGRGKTRRSSVDKGQLSVLVDADALARAKGALRLAAFYEDTDSLAQLVQNALEAEVTRLQDAYNGGEPVEPRTRNLTPGRRASS